MPTRHGLSKKRNSAFKVKRKASVVSHAVAETPLIASHVFLSRRRLSMYYSVKILCYNLIKVIQYQYRWKNGPEWCCGELMVNPFSYVVFNVHGARIRNGGMMCRSSCIVKLIACRVIRTGRVTRRKFVG